MTSAGAERRALRPLWMLATGAAVGSLAGTWLQLPPVVEPASLASGIAVLALALIFRRRWPLWLVAGLFIATGRGVDAKADRDVLAALIAAPEPVSLRLTATVSDGWTPTRWGRQARVRIETATHGDDPVPMGGRWRLEVRGSLDGSTLPHPGATFTTLASLRGDAEQPFLAVSSPRLLDTVSSPGGLPALRDRLAVAVLAAAGTDVVRIRSAELAGALVLGRRDLLPPARTEGWRRSGLAHLLAVSGLHVGLVAGTLWLGLTASGLHPRRMRWVLLAALPAYALLAGASASAVRAAVMACVYLGGRQLGRAVIPMASVLLTATLLLLARPGLATDAGFQLTVLVTAALVRWVPAVTELLRGPRRLAQIAAVPLVAQAAAAPLVAAHFRVSVPGAVAANLLVPLLLAPTLTAALACVLAAPLWPAGAAALLDVVTIGGRLLWLCGTPGRLWQVVLPSMPVTIAAALVASGWLALQPGRAGRAGAAAWCAVVAAAASCWWLLPRPSAPRVELLEVADGLAAVVTTPEAAMLLDGGRWLGQASELLADCRIRRLEAVLASHADEDHIGGLRRVIEATAVRLLVLPAAARASPEIAPLIQAARRRGTSVVPVARGSSLGFGDTTVMVLWPPHALRADSDNDRSLVVRVVRRGEAVLAGADIDRTIERRLARSGHLRSAVLVVPHHGSRSSCSDDLLDAVAPAVVLIPAGPLNRYHHPHPEVLERLDRRGLPYRFPLRDGRCGAELRDGRWVPFPG